MAFRKRGSGKHVPTDPVEILHKLQSYCAYQERCRKEVLDRLREWRVTGEQAEELVDQLEAENFVDEARFAQAFVQGKFKLRKWGRIRLRSELQSRNIPSNTVRDALNALETEAYLQTLSTLAEQKWNALRNTPSISRQQKVIRYLQGKGYEYPLIREILAGFASDSR